MAAYADGTVRAWDVLTKTNRYDLKGRSTHISALQFDDVRLIVDGTYAVVVMHDFSENKGKEENEDLEYIMKNADNGDEDDNDDGGIPSSTS
eukprot:CAMPEP_0119041030 /NCGR_PEP_ID=MMETSP1177-20130426/11134_1 /TAXON_ID=2985 /ORGANISM="Ochromonas sp, Strain CCMP1899" /LENGTH=91 /DNA_ID=CAMNT_0007006663 /DNA_START=1058 /DNA_END=1333 /DNA_ORIENTATION=+